MTDAIFVRQNELLNLPDSLSSPMYSRISEIKNLGPKTESWLNEIGVYSFSDLERLGSVEIYRLVKNAGFPASLNLVYAIEAALTGVHWTKLSKDAKAELKRAIQNI